MHWGHGPRLQQLCGSGRAGELRNLGPKGSRGTPGCPAMVSVAHAVTVGTEEGEVFQLRFPGSGNMEGERVVDLDVPLAERPVSLSEVERAHRALEGVPEPAGLADLAPAQGRVALTGDRPPGQQSALGGGDSVLGHFVRLFRDEEEFAGRDTVFDCLGREKHLGLALDECLSDERGQPPASGSRARVVRPAL